MCYPNHHPINHIYSYKKIIRSILHHAYDYKVTLFYSTTCITISLRTFHMMTDGGALSAIPIFCELESI